MDRPAGPGNAAGSVWSDAPGAGLPVQGDPDFAPGHLYYALASINRAAANSPITADTITDLREHGLLASTIGQPPLPTNGGLALSLDSNAAGVAGTRFRVDSDTSGAIWFILNASWNGTAWMPDASGNFVGGFCISETD